MPQENNNHKSKKRKIMHPTLALIFGSQLTEHGRKRLRLEFQPNRTCRRASAAVVVAENHRHHHTTTPAERKKSVRRLKQSKPSTWVYSKPQLPIMSSFDCFLGSMDYEGWQTLCELYCTIWDEDMCVSECRFCDTSFSKVRKHHCRSVSHLSLLL